MSTALIFFLIGLALTVAGAWRMPSTRDYTLGSPYTLASALGLTGLVIMAVSIVSAL